MINPALNQLGQVATALSSSVNSQQSAGVDLSGKTGANIFSVAAPQAYASSKNTGTASATVSLTNNIGALTASNYVLTFKGGAYSLTDASDGTSVALTGAGTAASPLTANGISIVVAGTPAAND